MKSDRQMDTFDRQREYIIRHAAQILAVAQAGYARGCRGAVLIAWPALDREQCGLVYAEEWRIKQGLMEMLSRPMDGAAERIMEAVQVYDPAWEVVILFLDTTVKSTHLHVAGFIPEEGSSRHLFMRQTLGATSH